MHLAHHAPPLGRALSPRRAPLRRALLRGPALAGPALVGLALVGLALLLGCERDSNAGEPPPVVADSAEDLEEAPAELVPDREDEPVSAVLPADRVRNDPLPEEIYYDLDEYEWYRQALPIVHGGAAYQALDTVVVLSTLELDSLGRFGEVLYWGRSGVSEPDTLFVPVFEGYWLPFARTGARP